MGFRPYQGDPKCTKINQNFNQTQGKTYRINPTKPIIRIRPSKIEKRKIGIKKKKKKERRNENKK